MILFYNISKKYNYLNGNVDLICYQLITIVIFYFALFMKIILLNLPNIISIKIVEKVNTILFHNKNKTSIKNIIRTIF